MPWRGIDIDFATVKNMAITGGQFIFTSNESVASAFSVITNTGAAETITLVNTQGTAAGAITLTTTAAGSIDINSGVNLTVYFADDIGLTTVDGSLTLTTAGATNGDMTLTVADKFTLASTDTAAAGISISTNGGAAETIYLHADQGTSQAAINLVTDVGGVTVTNSAVPDGQYGTKLSGSIAGATASQGVGLYVEGNISGAVDSKVYAFGSWLNITAGTPTDDGDCILSAGDFGVYAAAAPELADAKIRVLNLEYQVHSDAGPLNDVT